MKKQKLLVIGFGKMARAILGGEAGVPLAYEITVVKPSPLAAEDVAKGIAYYPALSALPADYKPDMVLLAVKPDKLLAILTECAAQFQGQAPLYLSIIAAKPLALYRQMLGAESNVLRLMPNLAIAVGKGLTLAYPTPSCSEATYDSGVALFARRGEVMRCRSEAELDALTVHTGCTPGFLFACFAQFEEALAKTLPDGVTLSDVARQHMARALIEGAVAYASEHPQLSFGTMAEQVATKGGLTEAGLSLLRQAQPGIAALFADAIHAALARGEVLAKSA